MKTKALLLFVFFFALVPTVNAQEAANESLLNKSDREEKIIERKNQIQEKKEENIARIEGAKALKEENKVKLEQRKKDRVQILSQNMFRRFKGFDYRFNEFIEKIESRIFFLESKGVDVSDSKDLLETAKESITASESVLGEAQATFNEVLNSEETSLESIKEVFSSTKDQFKVTHQNLIEVVASLKSNVQDYVSESEEEDLNNEASTSSDLEEGENSTSTTNIN